MGKLLSDKRNMKPVSCAHQKSDYSYIFLKPIDETVVEISRRHLAAAAWNCSTSPQAGKC